MKTKFILVPTLIFFSLQSFGFCGFFVSKADGTLKNKTSQVIIVRDDNKSVITMYNDYKGDAKEFAMVIPVPVVLLRSDIKVVENGIFKFLNDYSAPRLVEYYDDNPCEPRVQYDMMGAPSMNKAQKAEAESKGITIEASYTVGEYDILILGAKESTGLKNWLNENGYKIPAGAEEVLDPYIKSNLKFFVVKVNLKEKEKLGINDLRPIQIKFNSPKFMLPIRLGMANADGDQDMIVYAFTRKGRVESTNYRTVLMPTGNNIPLFIKKDFSSFYSHLFNHQWERENRSVAFIEYAWDVSPSNFMKCDPCVSTPPDYNVLTQAGVWWLGKNQYNDYVNEYEEDKSKVFFTRMHIRYNRKSFPQDLSFQLTPNNENFQARYVVTHPASGKFTCAEGKAYLKNLKQRRIREMEMLSNLTGKDASTWDIALSDEENLEIDFSTTYGAIAMNSNLKSVEGKDKTAGIVLASAVLLGFMAVAKLSVKQHPKT